MKSCLSPKNSPKKLFGIKFLAGAAALAMSSVAFAAQNSISLNFTGSSNTSVTQDGAGAVAVNASGWNNLAGAAGSKGALVNSTGTATGTAVAWSSKGTWGNAASNTIANGQLTKGYLDDGEGVAGSGIGVTVTISNVDFLFSNVFVIVGSDQKDSPAPAVETSMSYRSYLVNGVSYTGGTNSTTAGTDNWTGLNWTGGGTLTEGSNGSYLEISNIYSSNIVIQGRKRDGANRASIAGVQIQEGYQGTFLNFDNTGTWDAGTSAWTPDGGSSKQAWGATGSGQVAVFNNAGAVMVSGAQTADGLWAKTGSTTLSGDSLKLTSATGSGLGGVAILRASLGASLTINSVITQVPDFGFVVSGGGIVTLGGNNTYATSAPIRVAGGGILNLTGKAAGTVGIENGGTLTGAGSVGGNLIFNSSIGDVSSLVLGSGKLQVTGNVTVAGLVSVSLASGNFVFGTPYELLQYGGTFAGGAASFTITGLNADGRTTCTVTDVSKVLTLTLSGTSASTLTWAGASGNTTWDVKTSSPWTGGGAGDNKFYQQDSVVFTDTASSKTVTVTGTVKPATMTVDNSAGNDYTFTGAGSINLVSDAITAGTFVKNGTGTVTINSASNTIGGMTTINAGTLVLDGSAFADVAGNAQFGGAGGITINQNGTLQFKVGGSGADGNSAVLAKSFSGTGTVTVTGNVSGTREVSLSGANTGFNGTLNLVRTGTENAIRVKATRLGDGTKISVGNGTQFWDVTPSGQTVGYTFTNIAGRGEGNWGAIRFAPGVTYTGDIHVDSTVGARIGNNGGTGTFAGKITGGALELGNGGGILVLTNGANSQASTTIVTSAIRAGADGVFGTGALTQMGSSTLSSVGTAARTFANSYTVLGSATLGDATNNGKLTFTGGISLGDIETPRTLTIASDVEFGGVVSSTSGAGGLVKEGTGTLILTKANTYSGNTVINAGALKLTGSIAGSLTIADAVGLGGTGTVNGNLTYVGGGKFNAATTGALVVTGNASVTGQVTVHFSDLSFSEPSYDLLRVTGTLTGASNFVLAGLPTGGDSRQNFALDSTTDPKVLKLKITGAAADLIWNGTDGAFNWNVKAAANWTGSADQMFWQNDKVSFTDAASKKTVGLDGALAPASVIFNNSTGNDYTLEGTGNLAMPVGSTITKTGTGKVTIAALGGETPNTGEHAGHTFGAINVTGGVLEIKNKGTYLGNIVADGAGAKIVFSVGQTYANGRIGVAENVKLFARNGGTLEFTGGNFNGNLFGRLTTITAEAGSTILVSTVHGLGGCATVSPEIILNQGKLTLAAEQYLRYITLNGGTIDGASELRVDNGSALFTVTGTAASTISSHVSNNNNGTWDVADVTGNANPDLTISGVVLNTGALIKRGAGTMLLTGVNTYAGATTINAGTLQIGSGGTTGNLGEGTATVAAGATLAVNRSDIVTTPGALTGGGTLKNLGGGTAKFTGDASAFTGKIVGTAGTIAFANDAAPAPASVELASGAAIDLKKTDGIAPGTLALAGSGSSFAGRIGTAAPDIVGNLTIGGGHTLTVGTAAGVETLTVTAALTLDGAVINYTANSGTSYDKISVGTLIAGTGITNIHISSPVTGLLDLITVTGSTEITLADLAKFTVTGVTGGTLVRSANNKILQLQVGPDENTLTWKTGPGNWNLTDTTSWKKPDNTTIAWTNGTNKTAVFAGTAGTVTIQSDITAGKLQFDTSGYTIAAAAGKALTVGSEISVAGTGSATVSAQLKTGNLNKTGTGKLILTNDNNVTGGKYAAYLTGTDAVVFTNTTIADILPTLIGTINGAYVTNKNTASPVYNAVNGTGTVTFWFEMLDNSLAGNPEFFKGLQVTLTETGGNVTAKILQTKYAAYDSTKTLPIDLSGAGAGAIATSDTANGYGVSSMSYGLITISQGTLQVGDGGATGSLGLGTVVNNATLAFNRNNAYTVANNISGTGTIEILGGTATFTGALSYTGKTTVTAGEMILDATATVPAGEIVNNDRFTINKSADLTLANKITGTGTLTKNGAGALTLNNAANIIPTLKWNTGALTLPIVTPGIGTIDMTGGLAARTLKFGTTTTAGDFAIPSKIVLPAPTAATQYTIIGATEHTGNTRLANYQFTGNISGGSANATLFLNSGAASDKITNFVFSGNNTFRAAQIQLNRGRITVGSATALGDAANLLYLNSNANTDEGQGTLQFTQTLTLANPITINTANNAINTNANTVTLSGNIGGQPLVKLGTGTLILTGTNNYTGTTLNTGILQVGAGGTTGTLGTGATSVAAGTTLAFKRSDTAYNYTGALTGTGTLTNTGTGTVTLTNATGFTGTIAVSSGTLLLKNNAAPTLKQIEISPGAVLAVKDTAGTGNAELTLNNANTSFAGRTGTATADIDGSLKLTGGHKLTVGTAAGIETLTLTGGLTLAGNNTINFAIGTASGTNDKVKAATLAASGTGNSLALSFTGAVANGTYDLIATNADVTAALAALDFTGYSHNRAQLKKSADNKTIQLEITATALPITWNSTAAGGKWNTVDTNMTWVRTSDGTTASEFANLDTVTFDGDRTGINGNVEINTPVTPSGIITVKGATNFVFTNTGTGKIGGAASLLKQGTGTLTLTNAGANDFTGGITVTDGTLELAGTGALIANGGTASALGASTNAAANLVLAGGTLKFNGAAGSTANTDRNLTLGDGTSTLEAASLAANTIVHFTGTGTIAHTGTAARTLTLAGEGGKAAQNGLATANATNGGILALALTDASASAPLSVVKNGAGTWVLTGTNTHTGKTVVNAGLLAIASDAALGAVPATAQADNITIAAGATLGGFGDGTGNGNDNVIGPAPADIVLNAKRGITLTGTGNAQLRAWSKTLTVAGIISGTAGLTKVDNGILILTGANTFAGGVVINDGTLRAGTGAIPAGFGKGGLAINSSGKLELTGNVAVNKLDGSGSIKNAAGSTANTLQVGTAAIQNDSTYTGNISDGTGKLNLQKNGAGTLTLSGDNSFTGSIAVLQGTLVADSATALGGSTAISVIPGATLDICGYSVGTGKTITLAGTGAAGQIGALVNNSSDDMAVAFVDNIVLAASSVIYAGSGGTGLNTVSGTGDLTLKCAPDSGDYLMNGTAANINNTGTLTIEAPLTVVQGAINSNDGVVITGEKAIVVLMPDNAINPDLAVSVVNNALILADAGSEQTYKNLTTDNTVVIGGDDSSKLILDTTAGDMTLHAKLGSTPLFSGTNKISLTKTGTGTLTVNNADNDYTGVTTVTGGVLELAVALDNGTGGGALGDTANTGAEQFLLAAGTTLRVTAAGTSATEKLFTVAGAAVTIESNGSGLQFTNTGTIGGTDATELILSGTYAGAYTGSTANTLAAALDGARSLTVTGGSTWVVSGANTYTGATQIKNGTLALGADNAVPAASTVTLGDSANSGVLALNGRTLTVAGLATSGTGTGNAVINGHATTAGTLVANIATTAAFNGALGNAGDTAANNFAFTKNGTGTLTVSGPATYTGTTTIAAGKLVVAGAAPLASTAYVLNSGAAFDYAAGPGTLTLTAGSTLTAGTDGTHIDVTGNIVLDGGSIIIGGVKTQPTDINNVLKIAGDLTFASTSSLDCVFTGLAAGANSRINANNLTVAAGATVQVNSTLLESFLEVGSYDLIGYTNFSGNMDNFAYAPIDVRYTISFENDAAAKTIVMNVVAKSAGDPLVWTGTLQNPDGDYQWGNPSVYGANFVQKGVTVAYLPGDFATFDDTGVHTDVTVSATGVILGYATFDNSAKNYTVTGGDIGGAGVIEKKGTGTLTLLSENTYTGGTALTDGTLAVGHDNALGTGTLQLEGGTLQSTGTARTLANNISATGASNINTAAGDITLDGTIVGTGTIAKTGTGTLTLNGEGTAGTVHFTGNVRIDEGTVALGAPVNHDQATYNLAGTGTSLVASFAGDGTLALGALEGTAGTLAAAATGAKTFEIGNAGTDTAFAGTITDGTAGGTVALTKTGTGKLTLTGTTDYTGATTVNAGVLETTGALTQTAALNIATAGTFVSNTAADTALAAEITSTGVFEKQNTGKLTLTAANAALAGTVRISAGTLALDGTATLGTATIENNAALELNRADDYTLANTITGSGTLDKNGTGTLTYTGDNANTGITRINAGTLALAGGTAGREQVFASSAIALAQGTALDIDTAADGKLQLQSALETQGTPGTGANINKTGTGTVIFTAKTAGTGADSLRLNINEGVFQVGDGGMNGELGTGLAVNIADAGTLRFNRFGTGTIGGAITSTGTIEQTGGSLGTGTMILTNSQNQITGTLRVLAGTLQVGDTGHENATLNKTGDALTVNIAAGSRLLYKTAGNLGENITLTGTGTFEKQGSGTLVFDGHYDNFTGPCLVSNGTLAFDREYMPAAGELRTANAGILELRNGAETCALGTRITGTGILSLAAQQGTARTEFAYAGTGITGGIRVNDRVTLNLGTNPAQNIAADRIDVYSGGLLNGQGKLAGTIHNHAGGRIEPGNSVGQIRTGTFVNNGTLQIEINGTAAGTYDQIRYTDHADLTGSNVEFVLSKTLFDSLKNTAARITFVADDTAGTDITTTGIGSGGYTAKFIVDGVEQSAFTRATAEGGTLFFAGDVLNLLDPADQAKLRDGLRGYINYLDEIFQGTAGTPATGDTLTALLQSADPGTALNNASPLGLASMTAMTISAAHDNVNTRREHLESLRYEVGQLKRTLDWTPYVDANGVFARNGDGRSDPMFDFNTYGGNVGLDRSFGDKLILGTNVGYYAGDATIANGGGKVKQSSGTLGAYGTYLITDYIYADFGAFAGYDSYDIKHNTALGRATAKPDGFNLGANAYLGGIVPVTQQFHLTPYAGLEYVYADVSGFTEKGSAAALKVDGFTQNSLMAKIGTGINWIVPAGKEYYCRLGLDLAYGYEILDSEADITARFANDTTGSKFKVNARNTPEQSVMVGPTAEFRFDENKTITLGYTLEYDFENQYIHHINASFRMRF